MNEIPKNFENKLLVGNSAEILKKFPDESIDLIITSPPYWNAVSYHGNENFIDYETYLKELNEVFIQCCRVLRPNGKIAINSPIMPIPKTLIDQDIRHIKDISSDLSFGILNNTNLNLLSLYVWQKQTSKLMFGSYPYPGNLLENNTIEFIRVYVKPGKSKKYLKLVKENEKLKKQEWIDLIQQVWFMIPEDVGRKKNHPAPFPQKLPARLIKMYSYGAIKSFPGDIVLDPFVGTGTTCVVAKKMNRRFIGIDISSKYIENAKGRVFKAKENENINYLIGKTKHQSKEELDIISKAIDKSRNTKTSSEELIKSIKKHRSQNYGRDVVKKIEQPFLFNDID